MIPFDFEKDLRSDLMSCVLEKASAYYENTRDLNVGSSLSSAFLQTMIRDLINSPKGNIKESFNLLMDAMEKGSLHNAHPMYLGLFTPRVPFANSVSEFVKAVYNPNLGSWGHAPFAVESETFLIKELGRRFGYKEDSIDGIFTSGGAEGNLNGILCALNTKYKELPKTGVVGLTKKPVMYCSSEAHHSVVKAIRMVGLGEDSIRFVGTIDQKVDAKLLEKQIIQDLSMGLDPFLIISTAGTTGSGAIDPLIQIHQIAEKFGVWHHCDAAYGGALVFQEDFKSYLDGIEKSDSISFDLHKWPASPVGANAFLTRNTRILHELFDVSAKYMPKEEATRVNPYTHSPSWSRRFIGLSFLTMLTVYGWQGYAEMIEKQCEVGSYLKTRLKKNDWKVLNKSVMPLVCFTHSTIKGDNEKVQLLVDQLVASGEAWVSTYEIDGELSIRACITNYMTDAKDIDHFIDAVGSKLKEVAS